MEPSFVVLTETQFNKIIERLEHFEKAIPKDEEREEYLTSSEVQSMLNVCPKTLQNYRDKKKISFIQRGRKILYKHSDVEQFLNGGYIEK